MFMHCDNLLLMIDLERELLISVQVLSERWKDIHAKQILRRVHNGLGEWMLITSS